MREKKKERRAITEHGLQAQRRLGTIDVVSFGSTI